jgi:hypothetical protein
LKAAASEAVAELFGGAAGRVTSLLARALRIDGHDAKRAAGSADCSIVEQRREYTR